MALEIVGDVTVDGGFGDVGFGGREDEEGFELLVYADEGFEEVSEPWEGEDVVGGGGEVVEAIGDVGLEGIEVQSATTAAT